MAAECFRNSYKIYIFLLIDQDYLLLRYTAILYIKDFLIQQHLTLCQSDNKRHKKCNIVDFNITLCVQLFGFNVPTGANSNFSYSDCLLQLLREKTNKSYLIFQSQYNWLYTPLSFYNGTLIFVWFSLLCLIFFHIQLYLITVAFLLGKLHPKNLHNCIHLHPMF